MFLELKLIFQIPCFFVNVFYELLLFKNSFKSFIAFLKKAYFEDAGWKLLFRMIINFVIGANPI